MNDKIKGILFILLSAFCFAAMNLCVRMSGDIPTMQKCMFRNIISFFVAAIVILKDKTPLEGIGQNKSLLILRSFFGVIGILCNFYAIDRLALSDANALNKLSPFFAIFFSAILLKEKVSIIQWLMVLGAFIGSMLVLKPTGDVVSSGASFIGMLGGASAGVAYTIVRKLLVNGVKRWLVIGFFSAFSLLVMLPMAIANYVPMSTEQLLWLLAAGVFATGGQFGITTAYSFAPAREISVFDFSQILFSALLGFMFLDQVADKYSYIGYACIILCAAGDAFLQGRKDRRR